MKVWVTYASVIAPILSPLRSYEYAGCVPLASIVEYKPDTERL